MIKRDIYFNFNNDFIDIWTIFGIEKDCNYNRKEIDTLFNNFLMNNKVNENNYKEFYFSWKLLKDNYYLNCYKKYKSIKLLYESGFFIDQYEIDDTCLNEDNNWLSTPINKIKISKNEKEKVIILMTGAFSPLHEGHIECMEKAKKILVEQYDVIGGYISHSHDNYVDTKYNGEAKCHSLLRIKQAEKLLFNNEWIMVDKFESIDNKHSINFTDVIIKLKSFINFQFNINVKIAYVFGGDNSKFSLAFEDSEDISICLSRNHEKENFFNDYKLFSNQYYIKDNQYKNISSSLKRINKSEDIIDYKNNKYLIRDDSEYIPHIKNFDFLNKFKNIILNGIGKGLTIETVNIKEQHKEFNKIYKDLDNTISLDLYIKGKYNIYLSREFNLGDAQVHPNGLVNRPNFENNFSKIPNDVDYTLIEDDSISGKTISFLKEKLNHINIKNIILLSNLYSKEEYFDVIDLRDFILNTENGGLVVNFKGKTLRVPYLYPYVNLETRANILPDKYLETNLKLWNLNLLIFIMLKYNKENLNKNNDLIDLMKITNNYHSNLSYLDNVIKFCEYHINKINKIMN